MASAPDYHETIQQLDDHFTGWWSAFLLSTLDTLRQFRRYGNDDGQLVVLALAAAQMRAATSLSVSVPLHEKKSGMSLSEIAIQTGVPLETTRRTLLKLSNGGLIQRRQERYDIALPDELLEVGSRRALALNHIIRAIPGIVLPGGNLADSASEAGKGVGAYWTSVLCYCGNLRRSIAKGAYLSTLVAGVLQTETLVRYWMFSNGKNVLSRLQHNHAIEELPSLEVVIHLTALMANRTMPQTLAAARHFVELGLGTLPEPGLFRVGPNAIYVPEDNQGHTRGVKEALLQMLQLFPDVGSEATIKARFAKCS